MDKSCVVFRDNYTVAWGTGHNIQERKDMLVFIDSFRRNLAGNNRAKYAHIGTNLGVGYEN